jgi:DNA-directed RNA polymerase subunit RPC12/RpoP
VGCFDTVMVPCPSCGEKYQAQSKSGPCKLVTYELTEAPGDVLDDVNRHAPFTCEKCHATFDVALEYAECKHCGHLAPTKPVPTLI